MNSMDACHVLLDEGGGGGGGNEIMNQSKLGQIKPTTMFWEEIVEALPISLNSLSLSL